MQWCSLCGTPILGNIWQAELTFIHNYWYQQFELVISLIRIVDISNWIADINNLLLYLFELAISLIPNADISAIRIADINI